MKNDKFEEQARIKNADSNVTCFPTWVPNVVQYDFMQKFWIQSFTWMEGFDYSQSNNLTKEVKLRP
jgi:hypothetical protein